MLESIEVGFEDRYDRMRRIPWWNQEVLSKARVFVIGAGALGNELIKNLALLGVGKILVTDTDTIEKSNLARCVLFREGDDGKLKSTTAATRAMEINPHISVVGVTWDVVWGIGQGIFRRMDVVVGGLDNRLARLFTNRHCSMFGVPYIDGGMLELDGSVVSFRSPDTPCYECTLYNEDYTRLLERWPCFGLRPEDLEEGKMPTVATTSSIIAAVQSQEVAKHLHMKNPLKPLLTTLAGKEFRYKGHTLETSVYELKRKEKCRNPFCKSTIRSDDIYELSSISSRHSAKELYEEVKNRTDKPHSMLLETELVTTAKCPACGREREIYRPQKTIRMDEAKCGQCGTFLELKTTGVLPADSDLSLAELGIPPLYLFQVFTEKGVNYFEVTGDLRDNRQLSMLNLI